MWGPHTSHCIEQAVVACSLAGPQRALPMTSLHDATTTNQGPDLFKFPVGNHCNLHVSDSHHTGARAAFLITRSTYSYLVCLTPAYHKAILHYRSLPSETPRLSLCPQLLSDPYPTSSSCQVLGGIYTATTAHQSFRAP